MQFVVAHRGRQRIQQVADGQGYSGTDTSPFTPPSPSQIIIQDATAQGRFDALKNNEHDIFQRLRLGSHQLPVRL